jgi:hypothetical protein
MAFTTSTTCCLCPLCSNSSFIAAPMSPQPPSPDRGPARVWLWLRLRVRSCPSGSRGMRLTATRACACLRKRQHLRLNLRRVAVSNVGPSCRPTRLAAAHVSFPAALVEAHSQFGLLAPSMLSCIIRQRPKYGAAPSFPAHPKAHSASPTCSMGATRRQSLFGLRRSRIPFHPHPRSPQ